MGGEGGEGIGGPSPSPGRGPPPQWLRGGSTAGLFFSLPEGAPRACRARPPGMLRAAEARAGLRGGGARGEGRAEGSGPPSSGAAAAGWFGRGGEGEGGEAGLLDPTSVVVGAPQEGRAGRRGRRRGADGEPPLRLSRAGTRSRRTTAGTRTRRRRGRARITGRRRTLSWSCTGSTGRIARTPPSVAAAQARSPNRSPTSRMGTTPSPSGARTAGATGLSWWTASRSTRTSR